MENQKITRLPLPLMVLGLTALAYVVSFVFQYGFLNTYGISYKVIDVSIPSLIIGIAFTLLIAFNADRVTSAYYMLLSVSKESTPLTRLRTSYISTIPIIALVLLTLYGLNIFQYVWLVMFFYVFIMLVSNVIPVLINSIRKKSFEKGVAAFFEDRDKADARRKQIEHQGYFEANMKYVVWVVAFIIFSLVAGRLYASSQSGFYVTKNSNGIQTIMIQKTGDVIITKDYDTGTKELLPGFTLQKIDQSITFKERMKYKVDYY